MTRPTTVPFRRCAVAVLCAFMCSSQAAGVGFHVVTGKYVNDNGFCFYAEDGILNGNADPSFGVREFVAFWPAKTDYVCTWGQKSARIGFAGIRDFTCVFSTGQMPDGVLKTLYGHTTKSGGINMTGWVETYFNPGGGSVAYTTMIQLSDLSFTYGLYRPDTAGVCN
jgi:hypothetical protein